ncbi:MAG: LPS assembly protein LptD [Kiritimatiellae bacterium]|nr:LPS assembly protein LptD [Kiritimatiellia bacterium]
MFIVNRLYRGLWIFIACSLYVTMALAQVHNAAQEDNVSSDSQAVSLEGTEVNADLLEYELEPRLFKCTGNVVISNREEILTADYVEFYVESRDVYALGNVTLQHKGRIWQGEELTYNLQTHEGDFGTFSVFSDPYYIYAEESERVSSNKTVLKNVSITTCEGEDPEFVLQSREAFVLKGEKLRAKNVVLFLGAVPVLYLPYLVKDIGEKRGRFDVVPGYSSRMGAFLLTAYNIQINPQTRSVTHVDYRTQRGGGIGQDFIWSATNKAWNGRLKTYYTHDNDPFENEAEEVSRGDLINADRYRLRLSHSHVITPRDYWIAEISYLSDPDIVEDFFDDEFRGNAQPENRITFIHRGDRFTAAIELNKALNDFYDNVDRLPELTLDLNRERIGKSEFYYQGENSFSSLERVFKKGSALQDYDANRFDSEHTIFYPARYMGFLNVIPRAGYRATYYSKTRGSLVVTNVISSTDTNGILTASNVVQTVTQNRGSDLRNVYEIGVEASFKAFKIVHDQPTLMGRGLRHVVEPFANYTFIPRPNLEPSELFQFDDIDTLNKIHQLRLGVRNKYQTKRLTSQIHDLVAVETYTDFRLEPTSAQHYFSPLFFDAELNLIEGFNVDLDGAYEWNESQLNTFNTQMRLVSDDRSSVALEYRYRNKENSLLAVNTVLYPEQKWSFATYWRYEFETGELEEQSYSVLHKTDCLGIGLGVKQIDDDLTAWLQLWLLAFPRSQVNLRR